MPDAVTVGSSPHAWGTHPGTCAGCRNGRFIPTRMGNTTTWRSTRCGFPVHPHTHGEHKRFVIIIHFNTGSSPHAWGTHRRLLSEVLRIRFIPTRMGNTNTCSIASTSGAVHPHTHGEHRCPWRLYRAEAGSSPHAWGTLDRAAESAGTSRFIPTRMGNTGDDAAAAIVNSVHPHTHGEHRWSTDATSISAGSSPHAWGTRSRQYL